MGKSVDLTGKRFGRLVVIERESDSMKWKCRCDCNSITYASAGHLNSGSTTSCGCARRKDLTGKKIGSLSVIHETEDIGIWKCECSMCGNTALISSRSLLGGKKTCGCSSGNNISGIRFGKLVALRPIDERRNNQVVWECSCDCGETAYIRAGELRRGGTTACGKCGYEDLSGVRFGRLVALEVENDRKSGVVWWRCLCDCSEYISVRANSLKMGVTKSCGCLWREKVIEANKARRMPTSDKNIRERNYPEYKEWRMAVFERDEFICQKCGQYSGHHLNAHHIESYTDNKELRTVLENGSTLCKDCHDNFHHIYGRGNNTREQFNEWMGEEVNDGCR